MPSLENTSASKPSSTRPLMTWTRCTPGVAGGGGVPRLGKHLRRKPGLLRQQRVQVRHEHLPDELALMHQSRRCVVMKINLVAFNASATATATLSELTR